MKSIQYEFEFKYFDNVSAKDLKSGHVILDTDNIYEAEDIFLQYHPDAIIIMILLEGEI